MPTRTEDLGLRRRASRAVSGFALLEQNLDAFAARIAMVDVAEHCICAQYYVFRDDASGRVIAHRLLAAAARGVRVRLLIDDCDASGRDTTLGMLDVHPNIEVRVFDSFLGRRRRMLDQLTDAGSVARRMHFKAFIADGSMAVIGGRNIGDEYFSTRADRAHVDVDMIASGPVVYQVEASFNAYWASAYARRLAGSTSTERAMERLRGLRSQLTRHNVRFERTAYARGLRESPIMRAVVDGSLPLTRAVADVIADPPEPLPEQPRARSRTGLRTVLQSARSDVLITTPYLVPDEAGVALLCGLAASGVRVRILTNALAAQDVRLVHAGYARYRKALLEGGVALHELRPSAFWGGRLRRALGGRRLRASLHAKTLVVDGERLLLGSTHLDPCPARERAELGVVIRSAGLAGRVVRCIEQALTASDSWSLALEGGRVRWHGEDARGRYTRWRLEPQAGGATRGLLRLLRPLPLERQL